MAETHVCLGCEAIGHKADTIPPKERGVGVVLTAAGDEEDDA